MTNVYSHRNGETDPPEVTPDDFCYYWFQGDADYENWEQRGEKMIMITGVGTDRVEGLVAVTMTIDLKKSILEGCLERTRSVMLTEPESLGYDLEMCHGRWWGPVIPPWG